MWYTGTTEGGLRESQYSDERLEGQDWALGKGASESQAHEPGDEMGRRCLARQAKFTPAGGSDAYGNDTCWVVEKPLGIQLAIGGLTKSHSVHQLSRSSAGTTMLP